MYIERETVTFTLRRAGIEATQTGYTVTLERYETDLIGDLATYPYGPTTETADAAYRDAQATCESIKRGHWTGRRGEWTVLVRGKKVICSREKASVH
jgi:hypothetical protein